MSFEGYYEYLTSDGQYMTRDVFDDLTEQEMDDLSIKYFRLVDTTNGYDEETEEKNKIEIGYYDQWKTDHYGNKYAVKVKKYKPIDEKWHIRNVD